MNKLIFANLLHRPMRSVISVLAVAIEVIMILSIVGIFMGMLNDQKQRTNGIGADLMLLPSNASLFNGVGGASMPIKDEEVLLKMPHVTVVSPAIQKISTSGSVETESLFPISPTRNPTSTRMCRALSRFPASSMKFCSTVFSMFPPMKAAQPMKTASGSSWGLRRRPAPAPRRLR